MHKNNRIWTKYSLLLVLMIYSITYSNGQQVQIMPAASPSNSTLLSDYYSGKQNGLSILLRSVDTRQPLVQGYFRISIEGQGVKLQTGSYAIFPSIDILEASTVNIGPSELAVYFKPQYLQGSVGFGIHQPNVFPEGFYSFCFEFLEKNTSRVIGSMQCVQANLSYSEPVDLILPGNDRPIVYSDPSRIKFQWKPQHTNVSNSEYIFSLVEFDVNDKVTEHTFAAAQPIYAVKMKEEKLMYGNEQPKLLKGKKYAWRVQVAAVNEIQEQEPFKNGGYSEIYTFELQ